jgi:nucleotide-binding universal stress UspA family protein
MDTERVITMYATILWATDASETADGALVEALRLLEPGGRLVAFHCDERFTGGRAGGAPLLADETDRRVKLEEQVAGLRDSGIDVELVVKTAHHTTTSEILKAAAVHDVDAIVCGSRGSGVVAATLAGSVSMRLPHLASCPVVVVSKKAAERAQPGGVAFGLKVPS